MFVRSKAPYITTVELGNILAWINGGVTASGFPLGIVRLFTAAANAPSPHSVKADFTEATFDGYAQQTFDFGLVGPFNLSSGDGEGLHSEVDFLAAAVTLPGETILGYYIVNSGDTVVLLSELFDVPVPIVAPGDTISLDVILPFNWQVPTGE